MTGFPWRNARFPRERVTPGVTVSSLFATSKGLVGMNLAGGRLGGEGSSTVGDLKPLSWESLE